MKVTNITGPKGRPIKNQFIIFTPEATYFQSYKSIIVKVCAEKTYLDEYYWNYSRTTAKYRNLFLGETTKEIEAKIKSGEYELVDLQGEVKP